MITRAIDENNDWTFGRGKNNYLKNTDAVAQSIKTRMQSFLGNCFFKTSAGVDWFNLLGSKNQLALELALSTIILNTENVTGIVALSVNLDENRLITISYSVNTVYTGIADPNGNIEVSSSFILTEDGDILTTEDGDQLGV